MSVVLQDGRGYLKDARYIASEATAGGGVLKLKITTHLFGISFLSRDFVLAKILQWTGFRVDRTLVSKEETRRL